MEWNDMLHGTAIQTSSGQRSVDHDNNVQCMRPSSIYVDHNLLIALLPGVFLDDAGGAMSQSLNGV